MHDRYITVKVAYKLWTSHVELTRIVIVGVANNSPSLMNDIKKLLENQEDIGNTIREKYGDNTADTLTALLKEHITIAGDILNAIKNNSNAVEYFKAKWYRNADDISRFVVSLTNKITYDKIRNILYKHLDLTLNEAVEQFKGNINGSISWYNKALGQIIQVADIMCFGLLNQIALHGPHIVSLFT